MSAIKQGAGGLKKAEAGASAVPKQQNAAIAAILSNRAKIAGSDSDSSEDDSDSDISL